MNGSVGICGSKISCLPLPPHAEKPTCSHAPDDKPPTSPISLWKCEYHIPRIYPSPRIPVTTRSVIFFRIGNPYKPSKMPLLLAGKGRSNIYLDSCFFLKIWEVPMFYRKNRKWFQEKIMLFGFCA